MRVPCPVLALAVLALATTAHQIGILGLLGADTTTPARTRPPVSSSTSASTTQPARTSSTQQPTLTAPSTSVPSIPPTSVDGNPSKTWQVIGITIIAVLFIATSIACAMFFDRLCSLVKDVVCCTTRPLSSEQFIPDCEKQSQAPLDVYPVRARELPWNANTLYTPAV